MDENKRRPKRLDYLSVELHPMCRRLDMGNEHKPLVTQSLYGFDLGTPWGRKDC